MIVYEGFEILPLLMRTATVACSRHNPSALLLAALLSDAFAGRHPLGYAASMVIAPSLAGVHLGRAAANPLNASRPAGKQFRCHSPNHSCGTIPHKNILGRLANYKPNAFPFQFPK